MADGDAGHDETTAWMRWANVIDGLSHTEVHPSSPLARGRLGQPHESWRTNIPGRLEYNYDKQVICYGICSPWDGVRFFGQEILS